MSSGSAYAGALLEVLPCRFRKPEQVPRWRDGGEGVTYKLLREPTSLSELNDYNHNVAIWRDNDTLTYVSPSGFYDYPVDTDNCLYLNLDTFGPKLYITGTTDDAIAETAEFFLSLENERGEDVMLFLLFMGEHARDFRAAGSKCLAKLFEAAPLKSVNLRCLTLSKKQSIVMATIPHATDLVYNNCLFEDVGSTFVEALQTRKAPLGSLTFARSLAVDHESLRSLLTSVNSKTKALCLPLLKNELALLPFAAKVDHLAYEISSSSLSETHVHSLNIATSTLSLTIRHEGQTYPTDSVLNFYRRVADLGHFKDLEVTVNSPSDGYMPACVVQEIVRAALANSHLERLELDTTNGDNEEVEWDPHVSTLLQGLKDHPGLRYLTICVEDHEEAFGPDYCYLRKFLSHNRNITVLDQYSDSFKHQSEIEELYSLNRSTWDPRIYWLRQRQNDFLW
jgi:hypothetical protein